MVLCDTEHIQKLKLALAQEKLASQVCMTRYKALTSKIAQFQMGEGPAPTEEEFTQWLADVKYAVELKKLLDGVPGA